MPLEQQHTNHYNFRGLRLAVSCNDPRLKAALHARLSHWAAAPDSSPRLCFDFCRIADLTQSGLPRPVGRTRVVYKPPRIGGEVLYAEEEDRLYLHWEEHIGGVCHPVQGYAQFFYTSSANDNLWLVSHTLFILAFMELLKRQGRYSLHAAGLSLDGKGLLLPGNSGSGKTTLAIALLRAGFGLMGDDMVFLTPEPDGLQALAFPDEIDVTRKTVQLFPELHEFLPASPASVRTKRQIRPEALAVELVAACRPAVLIFPRVANVATSTLQPMGQDEALLEILPNIMLTDTRSTQAHFAALAELVRQSDCYRWKPGEISIPSPDACGRCWGREASLRKVHRSELARESSLL